MKRANRLRAPGEFAHVYATGRRIRGVAVSAAIARSKGPRVRIAVTCARRLGNAVDRNRAKRRLRAAISPMVPDLRPGSEIILQASPSILSISFQELHRELMAILKNGEVLDA